MVGLLILDPLVLRALDPSPGMWLLLGVGVTVFALLALRYGDRFWTTLADWLRSWWPFWP
jgi:hypothetical protein